jgi:hypothetical protein
LGLREKCVQSEGVWRISARGQDRYFDIERREEQFEVWKDGSNGACFVNWGSELDLLPEDKPIRKTLA